MEQAMLPDKINFSSSTEVQSKKKTIIIAFVSGLLFAAFICILLFVIIGPIPVNENVWPGFGLFIYFVYLSVAGFLAYGIFLIIYFFKLKKKNFI